MGEVRFMISEAAKKVHVESHVLRYWEEELDLHIGRTEMGHRYYTEEDIQLFRCIRKLKNEGVLLRDLKPLIPKLQAIKTKSEVCEKEDKSSADHTTTIEKDTSSSETCLPAAVTESEILPVTQLEHAKQLLGDVLNEVISANNKTLEKNISNKVTTDVLREMEFLFQAKERLEEEHFRKLDCLIRQQQATRRESARETPFGKLLRNFP